MNTTHAFGTNCGEFTVGYDTKSFHMDCTSGGFVGLAANVDRWISLGAGAIDARLGEIWGGDWYDGSLDRVMALPLLARAIYVADCDGDLDDQAEYCNA